MKQYSAILGLIILLLACNDSRDKLFNGEKTIEINLPADVQQDLNQLTLLISNNRYTFLPGQGVDITRFYGMGFKISNKEKFINIVESYFGYSNAVLKQTVYTSFNIPFKSITLKNFKIKQGQNNPYYHHEDYELEIVADFEKESFIFKREENKKVKFNETSSLSIFFGEEEDALKAKFLLEHISSYLSHM